MADKRPALIKTVGVRKTATGGAYTETDLMGNDSSIEPAAGMIEMADGTQEKAGSAHRLTLNILDPAFFDLLDPWQEDDEEIDIQFTTWDGPDNTLDYGGLGFTVTPIEPGEPGQLEGAAIVSFIYGLTFSDYVTLSEAL